MIRFFIKWSIYVILALLLLSLLLMTYRYQGESISGAVIDAETKVPLEGVVVVSLWELRAWLIHQKTVGYAWIDEAVTDVDGRYRLPAWGPKIFWLNHMGEYSPQLLFFKQDYQYKRLNNGVGKPTPARKVWRSNWDGKVVELERFEGNIFEYKRHMEFVNGDISFLRYGQNCEWMKIPYFLVGIHATEISIKNKYLNFIGNIDEDTKPPGINMKYYYTVNEVWNQEKCGSAKEFFKEYLDGQ